MHSERRELVDRPAQRVQDRDLITVVGDLARTIAVTRTELQRLDTGTLTAAMFPAATDELDAVVTHTASATEVILGACEQLEMAAAAGQAMDPAVIRQATTRIYEACSFQDITGQRISKVVATLKTVERKVGAIMQAFGTGPAMPVGPSGPESLTNGPQLPGRAMAQVDIDALLADV